MTVIAKVDADDATTYVSVDSGQVRPYGGPVHATGDGSHTVRAFAVGADEQYSDIVETTVRIDTTAPSVTGTGTKGVLRLTATDAQSGVAKLQYSTTNGASWKTYTKPVTFAGGPRKVTYRATDVTGNTSTLKTVNLPGTFTGGGSHHWAKGRRAQGRRRHHRMAHRHDVHLQVDRRRQVRRRWRQVQPQEGLARKRHSASPSLQPRPDTHRELQRLRWTSSADFAR